MVTMRAPWAFQDLVHELDRMTQELDWAFGGPAICTRASRSGLQVEEDRASLEVDLPGVEDSDISIELEDDRLTITASRSDLHREEEEVVLRERTYGDFSRQVQLPWPVKSDGVEAHLERGVLQITVHRAPESAPRRIQVTSA